MASQLDACWSTGYRCIAEGGPGHLGPHVTSEGIAWGGDFCDPARGLHVFPRFQEEPCECGKHRAPARTHRLIRDDPGTQLALRFLT